MKKTDNHSVQAVLMVTAGLLLVFTMAIFSDVLYWDRYLRAYTFETFVENPFPTADRLYPQETVPGVEAPIIFPRVQATSRTISAAALDEAVAFAEASDSTSLIVSHKGVIQLERYWKGEGADQVVYSFSMHKSIVALLLGIAIDEGFIDSIDDPLAKYLPEWRDGPRARITLRHALQMNSGLEPMSFPANPFSKHVKRQIGTNLAATALSFRLQGEPGSEFDYNGVNPTLLAMVIERATGRRYAAYLSEKLWRPIGNGDAAVWLDRPGGLARGATSLYAKPMDWLRTGQMLLNKGRANGSQVIPEDWLTEVTTPSPTNPRYGLLTWIGTDYVEQRTLEAFEGFAAVAETPFDAGDIIYFDGLGGQRVYVIPSAQLVIVRTGVLAWEWNDTRLPNLVLAGIKETP